MKRRIEKEEKKKKKKRNKEKRIRKKRKKSKESNQDLLVLSKRNINGRGVGREERDDGK